MISAYVANLSIQYLLDSFTYHNKERMKYYDNVCDGNPAAFKIIESKLWRLGGYLRVCRFDVIRYSMRKSMKIKSLTYVLKIFFFKATQTYLEIGSCIIP